MMRHHAGIALALLVCAVPAAALGQAPPARPVIGAPDRAEQTALRPLVDRGAVIVAHFTPYSSIMFCTIYVHVNAPPATVQHVIATPEEYPQFVPALSDVQVRARHGGRVAFRMRATLGPIDVTTDASLHAIGERRVDFDVETSQMGPGGARWDLSPEPNGTLITLTVWADPSQGNWLIRRVAPSGTYANWSASIGAETVLALGVKRRAENLAGASRPIRPADVVAPPQPVVPLEAGPWVEIVRNTSIAVLTLDDAGAVSQLTAVGVATYPVDHMTRRLMDPRDWTHGWTWFHDATIVASNHGAVRAHVSIGAPMADADGEIECTLEPGGRAVRLHGVSGGFAGEDARWDFVTRGGENFFLYSSRLSLAHVPYTMRPMLAADPWLGAGLGAFWQIVTVRSAFLGLP